MQAHTKKPHTENVDLKFTGPVKNKEKAIKALKELGFVDTSDSIPWREAFPELENEPSYSIALRGARGKEGLTQKELAEKTGIPQGHISSMENGKMEIGKERAKRLAKALDIDYRVFL
jgi:ribosome-binding protein aMBF1 (putative translation factor)